MATINNNNDNLTATTNVGEEPTTIATPLPEEEPVFIEEVDNEPDPYDYQATASEGDEYNPYDYESMESTGSGLSTETRYKPTPNQDRIAGLQQIQEDDAKGNMSNPTVSFQTGFVNDTDATHQRRQKEAVDQSRLSTAMAIEDMAGDETSLEILQTATPHLQRMLLEQQEEYMDPEMGPDKAHVDTANLAQLPDVDLEAYQKAYERETGKPFYLPTDAEARDRMASELKYMRAVSEIADNRSIGGKAVDLGVELAIGTVLPVDSVRSESFVSKVKKDNSDSFIGNFFSNAEDLESLNKTFWSLKPKDREVMYRTLVQNAKEVSDNPDVQKQLVTSVVFFGTKEGVHIQQMLDVFGLAPYVGAGVKLAKKVTGVERKAAALRIEKLGGTEAARERVFKIADRIAPQKALIEAKATTAARKAEGFEEAVRTSKEVEELLTKQAMLDKGEVNKLAKEFTTIARDLSILGEADDAMVKASKLSHYGEKMTRRMMSGVRASRGNPEIASKLAHAAMSHEEMAKVIGTSQLDAAMSAVPVAKLSFLTEGAAPEIAGKIHKALAQSDAYMKEGLNVLEASSTISRAEKEAFIESKLAEIKRQPDVVDFTSRKVTDIGNHEFSVEVIRPDKTTEIISVPYERSAITGGFISGNSTKTGWAMANHALKYITSARAKLGKEASEVYVDAVGQVSLVESKVKAGLTKEARQVFKGLNKGSKDKVQAVIEKGTLSSEEYSYNDLVKGGRPDMPQLTNDEYISYAKFRVLCDHLWELNNAGIRREMVKKGTKRIKVGDYDLFGEKVSPEQARKMVREEFSTKAGFGERSRIFVLAEKQPLRFSSFSGKMERPIGAITTEPGVLSQTQLEVGLQNGKYQLRKIVSDPVQDAVDGNVFYKYVLVDESAVSELPRNVTRKRKGWSPLIYQDANFFVKVNNRNAIIDGKPQTFLTTERAFTNIKDAETFAKQLNESGKFGEGVEAKVFRDRELSPIDREEMQVQMMGGYTSAARKSERLRMGLDGQEAAFVTPAEAIVKYMDVAAKRYAASQNKTELMQRWMKEANIHLPKEYQADIQTFHGMRGVVETQVKDAIVRDKLLEAHDQITTMLGHYGTEEGTLSRIWTNAIEGTLMRSDSSLIRKFGHTMYRFDGSTIPNLIRSVTTNVLLGWYNPAQLVVQGSAFAQAMLISPRHAGTALKLALKAGYDDLAFDSSKALRKSGKFSKDELEFMEAWRRSGLRETVLTHNDDFHGVRNGIATDRSLIGRIKDKNMLFFEMGELFNTRFSFATAYSEWKAANKGKVLDDAALRHIAARTDVLKIRMMDNNRAGFQRNSLAAIPTQFWQVTTKTFESMLGSDLTAAEKGRLFAGQLAFWGTAGTGIDWVSSQVMSAMGVEPEEIPDGYTMVRQGMVNTLLHSFGADVEIGSRANMFAAPKELLEKILDPETPLWEVVGGPSGSVLRRGKQAATNAKYAATGVMNSDDISLGDFEKAAIILSESVAEIPSSTRNLIKARIMSQSQAMVNSRGEPIWETDYNRQTILMKAFGFATTDEMNYFKLRPKMRIEKSEENAYVDALINIQNKYAYTLGGDETDNYEAGRQIKQFAINAVLSGIKDPETKRRIIVKYEQRVMKGTGTKEEYIRKMLQNYLINGTELVDPTQMYNPMVVEQAKDIYGE